MTALNWPGNDEVKEFSNTVGALMLGVRCQCHGQCDMLMGFQINDEQ